MNPNETVVSIVFLWIAFALSAAGSSLLIVVGDNVTRNMDLSIYGLNGGIVGLIATIILFLQAIFAVVIFKQ